jgi:8-oxo-dGTP pyrophosphatase MutT (NUDIX family)
MQPGKQQNVLEPVEQRSAGGAVFRESGGKLQVVIILTAAERRWQIPKGIIDPGETPEQAAVREVREESGVEAEIVDAITTTDYWFSFRLEGVMRRIHKFVDFYLMRYTGGDTADHEDEVIEARWVDVDKAVAMLEFDQERNVVSAGAEKLKKVQLKL